MKLDEYSNSLEKEGNSLIDKICIQLLLKIIKIFYNSSLNKFQINKEANKIIKFIKNTSFPKSSFIQYEDQDDLKLISDKNAIDVINLQNRFSEANPNPGIESAKVDKEYKNGELENDLEKLFEGELGNKIIACINDSNFSTKIFEVLKKLDLKNLLFTDNQDENKNNKIFINEEIEIIENSFEILCSILSFVKSDNLKNTIISNIEMRKQFSELCLINLINPFTSSIREKSSYSLIRLTKILSIDNDNLDLLAIIFNEIFAFLLNLEEKNYTNDFIKSKNKNKNKNKKNKLNLNQLFEFFSFIYDIYYKNQILLLEKIKKYGSNIIIMPDEYLLKIAKILELDIQGKNLEKQLPNQIFIGYIKILSKVVENNQKVKIEISENYNLIQEILTEILFTQNDICEYSFTSLEANVINKNMLKFINPDFSSDLKSNKRKNKLLRNVCYKFILSMLKNNVLNFEKFFSTNVLDDKNENVNKILKKDSLNNNEFNINNFDYFNNNNNISRHETLKR